MKTKVHLRLLSVLKLSIASHSRKGQGKGVAAFVVRQESTGVGLEWCEGGRTSVEARLALLAGYAMPIASSAAGRPRPNSMPVETEKTSGMTALKFFNRHAE